MFKEHTWHYTPITRENSASETFNTGTLRTSTYKASS